MRNLFDQYKHHENRLTHALASCLSEDTVLLTSFIAWAAGQKVSGRALSIVEQRLPGEPELDEDEAERRGLPDAWIYSKDGWALLIESKVSSPIDADQIARHLRTAERRGFSDCSLLILAVETPSKLPKKTKHVSWTELYKWLVSKKSSSAWAGRLASYMEIAEGRMLLDGYLREGTLTTFSGIHFDDQNPYSYPEAKRLLKLLMEQLRKSQALHTQLGIQLNAPGRGAITGSKNDGVWDFIRLAIAQGEDSFTKYPHLTLSIESDRAIVQVTIPNGVDRQLRRKLIEPGYEAFRNTVGEFLKKVKPVLDADTGASPFLMMLQRHYPSQRSVPIRDAVLEFDPRTAIFDDASSVKLQEQWLKATFETFSNHPQSNIQLGIGVKFPYREGKSVTEAKFVQIVEQTWLACRPVIVAMGIA